MRKGTLEVVRDQFILESLPNPKTLDNPSFAEAIQNLFYNLILKHAEYLYSEASDQVMAKAFEKGFRSLSENDLNNLEAWFQDPRFLNVLILLQARALSPLPLHELVEEVSKPYKLNQTAHGFMSSDIMVAHNQIWGSLLGVDGSILNLMIKTRKNGIRYSFEKFRYLEQVKQTVGSKETGESCLRLLSGSTSSSVNALFAHQVITNFLHQRINDTYLKTVDFCFYLTDQQSEYEKRNKQSFSYVAFIYDLLFSHPGYLRSVQVDDVDAWLKDFFATLLATLNDLAHITRKQESDDEIFQGLDPSFFSTVDDFKQTLSKVKENEFSILEQARLALWKIIIGREPKNGDMAILRNEGHCADTLAKIFAVPFNALLNLKIASNIDPSKAEEERLKAEAEIRNSFLNVKNLGLFWQRKIVPSPKVTPPRSRSHSFSSSEGSPPSSPLKSLKHKENSLFAKIDLSSSLDSICPSRDNSPLKKKTEKKEYISEESLNIVR